MSLPKITTREEFLAARRELLVKEKEYTRERDALSASRRELPMVEVEKEYTFDGPDGRVRLPDLFESRSQLIVYHFMFHPECGMHRWLLLLPRPHRPRQAGGVGGAEGAEPLGAIRTSGLLVLARTPAGAILRNADAEP